MPIIGEESIAASEVEGLRDPLVGREIDRKEPLVRCSNCDTTYFRSSYDGLVQSNRGQCLTCKADKFVSLRFSSQGARLDRGPRWQGVTSKSKTGGSPKRRLNLTVPLAFKSQRFAPPTTGESWQLVGSGESAEQIMALRSSYKSHPNYSHKSVVKWGGAYRVEEQFVHFSCGPDVFKIGKYGGCQKVGTALSRNPLAFLPHRLPHVLADFDIDVQGTCHIASTAFLRSFGGDIRHNPDIKLGSLYYETSVIGCRPDVPRMAHFYRAEDKRGTEGYYLHTSVVTAMQLLNSFPHLKGMGGAVTKISGGYMRDCRLEWSPSGNHLLINHDNLMMNLRVVPIQPDGSAEKRSIVVLKDDVVGSYYRAAWHPTLDVLAVGYTLRGNSPDVGFYLIDFRNGGEGRRLLEKNTGQSNVISAIDWSPDGRCLAVASKDSTVVLYEFETDDFRTLYTNGECHGVHFSPDAQRFAVSEKGQVSIWSVQKSERVASFEGGGWGALKGSPWSRGGREILINTKDMTVLRLQ